MLDSWHLSIFCNINNRLQDSTMKLVHAERNGEAFDSQLVIGVKESYGKILLYKFGDNSLLNILFYDSQSLLKF